MATDVVEQLAELRSVYDGMAPPVTAAEAIARADSTRMASPEMSIMEFVPSRRVRRRGLVPVTLLLATAAVVLAAIVVRSPSRSDDTLEPGAVNPTDVSATNPSPGSVSNVDPAGSAAPSTTIVEATAPSVASPAVPERVPSADLPARLGPVTLVDTTQTVDAGEVGGATVQIEQASGRLCIQLIDENATSNVGCANNPNQINAFLMLHDTGDGFSSPDSTFELVIIAPTGPQLRLVDRDLHLVCELHARPVPQLGDVTAWSCAGPLGPDVWDLEVRTDAGTIVAELPRTSPPIEATQLPQIGDIVDPGARWADWISLSWTSPVAGSTDDRYCDRTVAVSRHGVVIGFSRTGLACSDPNIYDQNGANIGRFTDGSPVLDDDPPASATVGIGDATVILIGDGSPADLPIDGTKYAVSDQTLISSGLARPSFFDWHDAVSTMLPTFPTTATIVVAIGSNDAQDLEMPDGSSLPFNDPRWSVEYSSRVAGLLDLITTAGHPVVWIGVGDSTRTDMSSKLAAVRDATLTVLAGRPDVSYIDTPALPIGPTEREFDGYHLNGAGRTILTAAVDDALTELGTPSN